MSRIRNQGYQRKDLAHKNLISSVYLPAPASDSYFLSSRWLIKTISRWNCFQTGKY